MNNINFFWSLWALYICTVVTFFPWELKLRRCNLRLVAAAAFWFQPVPCSIRFPPAFCLWKHLLLTPHDTSPRWGMRNLSSFFLKQNRRESETMVFLVWFSTRYSSSILWARPDMQLANCHVFDSQDVGWAIIALCVLHMSLPDSFALSCVRWQRTNGFKRGLHNAAIHITKGTGLQISSHLNRHQQNDAGLWRLYVFFYFSFAYFISQFKSWAADCTSLKVGQPNNCLLYKW